MKSKTICYSLSSIVLMSFKGREPENKVKPIKGTYGFCNCDGSNQRSLKFNLSQR